MPTIYDKSFKAFFVKVLML